MYMHVRLGSSYLSSLPLQIDSRNQFCTLGQGSSSPQQLAVVASYHCMVVLPQQLAVVASYHCMVVLPQQLAVVASYHCMVVLLQQLAVVASYHNFDAAYSQNFE